VHAIASSGREGRQPTIIRVGHRPEDAALAWLLAGWLEGVFDSPVTVQEDPQREDDILTLSFDDGLELRLGTTSVTVEDPRGPAPFAAASPQESESEAVAAELRVLTHDASFHAALATLARRFGGA
jgi:hypothetical protein